MVTQSSISEEWVFLLHRLPRVPSAPRITLWRTLRRLGALLVGDGIVALPRTPRTVEHLEWLAAGIKEKGGDASVWVARATTRSVSERLTSQGRDSVESEYRALIRASRVAMDDEEHDVRRAQRRLRRQLHSIVSRDFFAAPSGHAARAAVEALSRTEVVVA